MEELAEFLAGLGNPMKAVWDFDSSAPAVVGLCAPFLRFLSVSVGGQLVGTVLYLTVFFFVSLQIRCVWGSRNCRVPLHAKYHRVDPNSLQVKKSFLYSPWTIA